MLSIASVLDFSNKIMRDLYGCRVLCSLRIRIKFKFTIAYSSTLVPLHYDWPLEKYT